MKKSDMKASEAAALLDRIKILAVQAMFSDDALLEQLVLKGGNAMALGNWKLQKYRFRLNCYVPMIQLFGSFQSLLKVSFLDAA